MSGVDYSKWDNIDISDDEEETPKYIEKGTWKRLRARQRRENAEKAKQEREELARKIAEGEKKLQELKETNSSSSSSSSSSSTSTNTTTTTATTTTTTTTTTSKEDIEKIKADLEQNKKDLAHKERTRKWQPEEMCYTVEDHTVVGGSGGTDAIETIVTKDKTERIVPEKKEKKKKKKIEYPEFVDEHQDMLERYLKVRNMEKSKKMLVKHGEILLHEQAQAYFLLSCLEDEMNGKHKKMKRCAVQCQYVSNIIDLGKSMQRDARSVVAPFFKRVSEEDRQQAFKESVHQFVVHIEKRAVVKRKEMEEEERKKRLGPGGVDPQEVMDTLPQSMKDAFESRIPEKLQQALDGMDPKDASYHMKRCIDSGLWVPNAGGGEEQEEGGEEEEEEPAEAAAEPTEAGPADTTTGIDDMD